jgi:hypothetical protein
MSSELGPEARSLIADADGVDSPSRGDKERVRSALAVQIGVVAAGVAAGATAKGAVASATGAGAGAKVAGGAIAGGGAALAAKLIGGAVVVSTIALGVSALTRRDVETTRTLPPEAPTSNVSAPPPASRPAPASTTGGTQGSEEETHTGGSPAVAHPAPPARGSVPTAPKRAETEPAAAPAGAPAPVSSQPPAPEVDGEAVLLQRAQAAIAAGDGVTALSLLDAHQQRFPNGVLAEQREAERVLALCAMGRVPAAREAAERFLAARPRSAQADRVRRACRVP